MDKTLKVTKFSQGVAEVYQYRLNDYDWAVVFIDEASGTVAIHSSYGEWSFCWPANGRGTRTLKEFLCYSGSGCYDYLANKFMQGVKEEFDYEQTVKDIQDIVAEACDDKPISYPEDFSREVNEWLEDGDGSDSCMSAEIFYERMPSKLQGLVDPCSVFAYRKPHKFYWLRDGVLPAIIGELRKIMPQEKVECEK